MSGPRPGSPPTDQEIRKALRRQTREDERKRVEIEGTFGEAKRVYGLDRVATKRADTSETTIAMAVMVMNLAKIFRDLFAPFLFSPGRRRSPLFLSPNPALSVS